jgi:imidazolonepropionase-like amidohydrolase
MREAPSGVSTEEEARRNVRELAARKVDFVKIWVDTFLGYAEHHELELMAAAGMTPMQVIVAATRTPAELLRLGRFGTVAPGKSADFIVLDANPLENIANTRTIARVYQRGKEINRQVLRAGWTGGSDIR